MNKLYFGNNLEIMEEMPDSIVDLICTDPPFNSGRDYNTFLLDSRAQKKAFTDTWNWDTAAQDARADVERRAGTNDTYKALDTCLKGYDMVLQNAVAGNKGSMRAYLAFMGPRLAEMHRLLKDTGSLYLHCDPTASHYLKGVMDAIFDQNNRKENQYFRNEIVWHYSAGSAPKTDFKRKHDIILRYVKNIKCAVFNQPYMPYLEKDRYRFRYADEDGRKYRINHIKDQNGEYKRFYWDTGTPMDTVWTYIREKEINQIGSTSKERLHYETQKPRALYERIITVSSNPNDLIMDPFAGCGTTIDAAHGLKRFWIGIDLTILALDPIRKRMNERHHNSNNEPLQPHTDYEIVGYPTNMQEVRKLVRDEKKYHDFSNWAVTRLGLTPTKDVGDGGKDGEAVAHITLWNPGEEERDRRIYAEVKSGNPTITEVRAFCHTIQKHDAIGIFITIEPVSDGMRQEAEDMGTFTHNNTTYPRLQFWQITDAYFENPESVNQIIRLPREWIQPGRKAERHFAETQMELL